MQFNKQVRGVWFYFFLAFLFLLMVFGLRETLVSKPTLTYKAFQELLEQDQIARVEITQNKEVPTGVLEITRMDGSADTLNVSDVEKVQSLLDGYDVAVQVDDVEKDSIFLTTFLPILMMGVMIVFFIVLICCLTVDDYSFSCCWLQLSAISFQLG